MNQNKNKTQILVIPTYIIIMINDAYLNVCFEFIEIPTFEECY